MAAFNTILLIPLVAGIMAQSTAPSGLTQPSTASNCNRWYTVKSGDACHSIESTFRITHRQFIDWNPAVSNDCLTNFWPKYAYCVGVDSKIKPSSSAKRAPTSSRSTATLVTKPTSSGKITPAHTPTPTVNATYSIRNPITPYNISTPTIDRSWPPKKTQAGQPSYCNKW